MKADLPKNKQYRYLDWIMAGFVTVLLCSNLIGASKVCKIGSFTFGAGVFFFPLSYVFGDILTEVYGYAQARRVVWAGFCAMIFASLMSAIIVAFPASPDWPHQSAYENIFGITPRLVGASLIAFFLGEFANSYVLAKMKVNSNGKYLWARMIGSTVVGEAVDSVLFYPLAFWGVWPDSVVMAVTLSNYAIKVGWETLMTPLTSKIVRFLKTAEQEDFYDRQTDFSPFKVT